MTNIIKLIKYEEGWRSKPYMCSENYPTVGFGFKIGTKNADINQFKFTLPENVGEVWLTTYLDDLVNELAQNELNLLTCSSRDAVLISMAYQMGVSGLLKFKMCLAAYQAGDWDEAAKQMLDSRWARQTPKRANRHAEQMKTGVWCDLY